MHLIPMDLSSAESGVSCSPPLFDFNRADENYQYLREPTCRTGFWDPVKYIPLDVSGSWYLSLGGKARERYEYLNNPNWGAGPPGSGFLLQRYFLHGDLHMGEQLRLFAQLQSSCENDRNGGPRPTDKNERDLHQDFLDMKGWSGWLVHDALRPSRIVLRLPAHHIDKGRAKSKNAKITDRHTRYDHCLD